MPKPADKMGVLVLLAVALVVVGARFVAEKQQRETDMARAEAARARRQRALVEAGKTADPDLALALLQDAARIGGGDADLTARIESTTYAAGRKALEAGDPFRAVALLGKVPDFLDARALAARARERLDSIDASATVHRAQVTLLAGDLKEAARLVAAVASRDVVNRADQAALRESLARTKDALYEAGTQATDVEAALAVFRVLGTTKDAPARVAALEARVYAAAKAALARKDTERARALFGALGDYADSVALKRVLDEPIERAQREEEEQRREDERRREDGRRREDDERRREDERREEEHAREAEHRPFGE